MEKNVIYGEKIQVQYRSLGLHFHDALIKNVHSTTLVDAFTNKTRSNQKLLFNSCRLADSLKNYGLSMYDVIGVFSENCLEYFDPILAAFYLGIATSTFSSLYSIDELKHACNLSKPKILFCSQKTAPTALKVLSNLAFVSKVIVIDSDDNYQECQSLNNFINCYISDKFNIVTFKPVEVDKNHPAFILFSSGTTGSAKGVVITHYNINTILEIVSSHYNTTTKQIAIGLLPFSHTFGLFVVLLRLLVESKVVVMNKFDPNTYLKTLQDEKINHLHIVPFLGYFLAKSDLVDKYDLSNIKSIISGGAPLKKSLEEELAKRLKITNIRQGYGMTELTYGVLAHNPDTNRYGSCGKVLPNIALKIVDVNTGCALGPMERGELCCRGDLVMKEYINNPESTKNTIDKDGWLHTGDIAYYDNERYFYIVDRLKELIKYKGFQVAPAELEALLLTHPNILDAGVIGIPDEECGELPFAFVVKAPNSNVTEKEIIQFVAEKTSAHKRLRGGVQFVKDIPRTPTGKILRQILRQRAANFKAKL